MKIRNILIILPVFLIPVLCVAEDTSTEQSGSTSQASMFTYKPPLRGAPITRVGAGTRGDGKKDAVLYIIAPEHTGLTLNEQPSLYWYTENNHISRLEFALLDDDTLDLILEINLDNVSYEGFQHINLADYNVSLKQGFEYQWSVASVRDDKNRSGDVVVSGTIAMSRTTDSLKTKLSNKKGIERVSILAKEGIWYDAFDELDNLINQQQDNMVLKKARSDLLRQVALDFAPKN